MKIALLHPGAMGVTLGQTLKASGHEVRWLSAGRSLATRMRAEHAGLREVESADALLDQLDAVLSVCPPAAATGVARWVCKAGFSGLYLDANAVSPATAREIRGIVGERFVDGGIIGPPALEPGTTRLYLSGPDAATVAEWFAAGPVQAMVVEGGAGAASALKMAYAAYTKGLSALLLGVRAMAEAEAVTPALLREWEVSQPDLAERCAAAARSTAGKAWRFVGEMEEIADTFESAGLPDGFHRAAAQLYQRMTPLKSAVDPTLGDVLACLLAPAWSTADEALSDVPAERDSAHGAGSESFKD